MTDNLRIWDALSHTDPAHTKSFKRAGGFSGTATKPIWMNMRLTDHFGPCGIGWGMTEPTFQVVPANNEILVYCTVGLWYRDGDHRSETVYGVGGDKVLLSQTSGLRTNDEAFKASYTDALSNAMKQIGVAADIHMGLFDDDKYVREMKKEFSDDKGAASPPPPPSQKPTASAEPTASSKPSAADNEKFERETVAKKHAELKAAKTPDRIDEILNDPWIEGYLKRTRKVAYDGIQTRAEECRTALSLISTGI